MEAVHEGVYDLHRLGFIDKRKMQKYDLLCLGPAQNPPAGSAFQEPVCDVAGVHCPCGQANTEHGR